MLTQRSLARLAPLFSEEHGPLAILNVQYRVPPYPVYSNQLNLLVGACLFRPLAILPRLR